MAADGGCKGSVAKAVGREISDAEFAKVRADIDATLRRLWRQEPATMRQMSKPEQQRYAARVAADQLLSDAARKKRNLALSIATQADNMAYLRARGMTFGALNDALAFTSSLADDGPGRVSVESEAQAISSMAKSELLDLVEAANGKFFGFVENGDQVRQFMRTLWGETSDNPAMAKAVQSWRKITDELRERFNRSGGDIGNLGDLWHLPQGHDSARIAIAGFDKWVEAILPKLDRRQYINADGGRMTDAQLREFLSASYDSITTNGANRLVPGQAKGKGARANRHRESRQIFFKDADAYMDYQLEFGAGDIYSLLFNHIDGMAKDIALVEAFGPNPEAQVRLMIDTVYQERVDADRIGATARVYDNQRWRTNALFEEVAGIGQGPANAGWAGRLASMRSWITASKLGSAILSSITDHATMVTTARLWNLPEMQMYRNYLKTLNPANVDERRFLQRQGLAINTFAAALDRFSGDYGGTHSHKIANAVMRASGLTAITEARRRAFSATMMSALGHLAQSKAWDQLDASDLKLLKAKGITPEVYGIWQKAKLQTSPDFEGGLLSGRAIMEIADDVVPLAQRQKAASQLMALVLEEQNMAVIEAGARERSLLYAGTKKGTLAGELTRSFMQFKTFPLAMLTRHWRRGLSMPSGGGKAGYLASLFVMSTLTGAMAMEIKSIMDGKDPRDLWETDDPQRLAKTWTAAAMQGGALGIFGDFLTSSTSRTGSDLMSTVSGPGPGLVGDVGNLVIGNMAAASMGEETDVGADAIRIVRGLVPGSSLWYAKAAFNNLVFFQLQELASPGYLDRMRRRVERETGQEFWWTPGEMAPERAPDITAAVGGE